MDEPEHMQMRTAERQAAAIFIRDAITSTAKDHQEPDHWERVHIARALNSFFRGAYGLAMTEADLSLTPKAQRSPQARLPTDPFYERCTAAFLRKNLWELCSEPVRAFPHFGPIVNH